VTIGPKTDVTFDPDSLDISVKLKPDSPTDEATRLNKAVTLKKELQFSTDDALEGAGMQSLDRSNQSYLDEQFSNALLQAKLQEILATSQLKIKQLEMQMQMQMQQMGQQQQQMAQQQQPNASGVIPQNQAQQTPQQANQDMNQGQAFNTAQGQAYNTGQGGASPYSAAPGMNREQINGQDQSGNPVGG
jgi:exonuclease VII large subunit